MAILDTFTPHLAIPIATPTTIKTVTTNGGGKFSLQKGVIMAQDLNLICMQPPPLVIIE